MGNGLAGELGEDGEEEATVLVAGGEEDAIVCARSGLRRGRSTLPFGWIEPMGTGRAKEILSRETNSTG